MSVWGRVSSLVLALLFVSFGLSGCAAPAPGTVAVSSPAQSQAEGRTEVVEVRPGPNAVVSDIGVGDFVCSQSAANALTDGVHGCRSAKLRKTLPCWPDPGDEKSMICWPGVDVDSFQRYPRPAALVDAVSRPKSPVADPVLLADGTSCRVAARGVVDDAGNEMVMKCGPKLGLYLMDGKLFDDTDPLWKAMRNAATKPKSEEARPVAVSKAFFTVG